MSIRKIRILILNNKKEITTVLLWVLLVSLIVIISYYSIYLTSEKWKTYKIAWHPTEGPRLNIFGIIIIFISSMSAGLFLKDAKKLVYGLLLTLVSSFFISICFGFLYIWFCLGYSETIGRISYGWEWVFLMSFLNCFKMYFPYIIAVLIFGAGIGCLTSAYMLRK
jgi:hypothetical protein